MSYLKPLAVAGSAVLGAVLLAGRADAQEFRVFTTVYDLTGRDQNGRSPVVARAATLFHAGKAYDHLDGAEEVVVFEPTKRRLRVLNTARGLAATVEFDEINHLLKIARDETGRRAAELGGKPDPQANRTAGLLRFQLDPRFEEQLEESGLLSLNGGFVRYEVKTAAPPQPQLAAAYLDYADWLHRLNYLLTPNPVLPDVRCGLNQSLKTRGLLPAEVEQTVEFAPPLKRRALHEYRFELNSEDRDLIRGWDAASGRLRPVPLREYQHAVVTARTR